MMRPNQYKTKSHNVTWTVVDGRVVQTTADWMMEEKYSTSNIITSKILYHYLPPKLVTKQCFVIITYHIDLNQQLRIS